MTQVRKASIDNLKDLQGKRVLVRVDFNVPLSQDKTEITDNRRIRAALPTIQALRDRGARVILITHLGRPKGRDPIYSTQILATELSRLGGFPVRHCSAEIGPEVQAEVDKLQDSDVLLLENIRFDKAEKKNDRDFARKLAELGDYYVNDAFGTAHRAHASTAGLANFLYPVAGYLMQKEIEVMQETLENPEHPFVAILGGAKVSDKIAVIKNLLKKADQILIGGGMAYTFLKAQGHEIGKSICEEDKLDLARELLDLAEARGVQIVLPADTVAASEYSATAVGVTVSSTAIADDLMGLDIGPETVQQFSEYIAAAKTVVWNGPLGVFEFPQFAIGTNAVAEAVAKSNATSIIGGGDLAAAVEQSGVADQISHISTGGGAALEMLEGKNLPGIAALEAPNRAVIPAGNWKMNLEAPDEARAFFNEFIESLDSAPEKIIFAVPFTALEAAVSATAGTKIFIGAENMNQHAGGTYTGEISPRALAAMAVPYVILGHSERRQYFNETNSLLNEKVKAALHWGLKPIYCCGESLAEREAGATLDVIREQIIEGLAGLKPTDFWKIAIAYEPIWAIGTGKTATSAEAEEVCAFIRKLVAEQFSAEAAEQVHILYGGSVKPDNAAELFTMPNIDGGLVGGASMKVKDFIAIVTEAKKLESKYLK
ncbi:MAG: triose-phosphate isomerase [Eubacteriales bacterium]|nr:triose-phosphate isomerase [Eubacteriales bacterium]